MKKNHSVAFLLLLILLATRAIAFGGSIYGPEKFLRSKGKPEVYTESITATAGGGTLVVKISHKSLKKGCHRVTRAFIKLNGRVVMSPWDFKKKASRIMLPIRLLGENRMEVKLMGQPGSYLTIELFQASPSVSLSAAPQTVVSGDSATLSWESALADACTISPDIGTVDPNGSITVSPEETTTYTIWAEGKGGQASGEATLTVLNPGVAIDIENPMDGALVYRPEIAVSGTVSADDASVAVNGVPAIVRNNRFIAAAVPLQAGDNTLTATADNGQHTAEDSVRVSFVASDLSPVHIEYLSYRQDPASLKTSGSVRVTVGNTGSYDIGERYRIVLFEDLNTNGRYEKELDNTLGQKEVETLQPAQTAIDAIIDFSSQMAFRDNLIHACVDVDDNLTETDETNNTIGLSREGIDLSASRLVVDTDPCPAALALRVRLGNAGSLAVGSGIAVTFYWESEQGEKNIIGTAFSATPLAPGQYEDILFEWRDPVEDAVKLTVVVNDDGRDSGGSAGETDVENNRAHADESPCLPVENPNVRLSGLAINALDGSAVPAAWVALYASGGHAGDSPIVQTHADDAGCYAFSDLLPGDYELVADKEDFETDRRFIHLPDDNIRVKQNVYLSPTLAADEVRIVLSWGATPADLEAHLTGSNPDGCRHHCYYWNREIPGARLDIDATTGFGPETITLSGNPTGVYRYYVHDFSDRLASLSAGLAASSACVRVIFGNGRDPLTFDVPAEPGSVWHVFDFDGSTAALTPVNRMGYQDEPGKIDFPKIISNPPTQAEAGFPYTYAVRAVDPDTDALLFRLLDAPEGMHIDPFSGRIDWTPEPHQSGAHAVTVGVTDPHCGEDTQRFSLYVALLSAPSASFSVSPCSGFNPGGDITLYWTTSGATLIEIDNGIGPVAEAGQLTLASPLPPTEFTLSASNAGGKTIKRVPNVETPTFTICDVAGDGRYRFAWVADCATDCTISPTIGQVPCSGSMEVALTEAVEYTLIASNPAGDGAVRVAKPHNCAGEIEKRMIWTEAVCQWAPGNPVAIEWSASWAKSTRIEPDIGSVSTTGNATVAPMQPTGYTLFATDADGVEVADVVYIPELKNANLKVFSALPR